MYQLLLSDSVQWYVFLDQKPWITVIAFSVIQLLFFGGTLLKLHEYRSFFRKNQNWNVNIGNNAYQIETDEPSKGAKELINEINEYLAKNEGTTDFGIIKDKTERKVDSLYQNATSKVSYPTYLGLMGTFFGVYIGLQSFKDGVLAEGVSDKFVSELIGGIIVSMVTSLVGLLLMLIANWYASGCFKKVESFKNSFYDFLQVELIPVLGTSMVSALHKLHTTINRFEPAFSNIIGEFKRAFKESTDALRETFGEKVNVLLYAVDTMGKNMTLINENVQKQDELLKTMRQKQTLNTLDKFVEAADKFDLVTSSIDNLNEIKDEIATSSMRLIEAQNAFIQNMAIPERVFDKVNGILNRIITFENSINALGENISQTQLLGNNQMNLIEEQITAIQKKTNLAISYQETTDEKLQQIYEEQAKAINSINAQYRAAIQRHGDDFEGAMVEFRGVFDRIVEECKQAVEEKRDEFIQEIKKSIDLEEKNQHLAKLDKIPDIISKLEEIKKDINKAAPISGNISSSSFSGSRTPNPSYTNYTKNQTVQPASINTKHLPINNGGSVSAKEPKTEPTPEPEVKKSGWFGWFGKRK